MAKAAKKAVRRAVVKKAVRKKVASAVRLEPHKVESAGPIVRMLPSVA